MTTTRSRHDCSRAAGVIDEFLLTGVLGGPALARRRTLLERIAELEVCGDYHRDGLDDYLRAHYPESLARSVGGVLDDYDSGLRI